MGLREEVWTDLGEAFANDDELGQAYGSFTGSHYEAGEYVPGTGQQGGETITYIGQYWRDEWSFSELQTLDLDAQDIKIGMLQNAVDRRPEVDDTLTLDGSTDARVVSVSPDPVGATFVVHLRVN